jgi:hypothetical protein
MRSYIVDGVVAGEVITERELMSELRDIADHANNLDDDNFQLSTLTSAKLETGALNVILYESTETVRTVAPAYNVDSEGVYAVPDGAGDPWVVTFLSSGGVLHIMAQVSLYDSGDAYNGYAWVGLRVNGELVARSSDQEAQSTTDTFNVRAILPFGIGTQVIEVVFGVSIPTVANTERPEDPPDWTEHATDIDFADRLLIVREASQ